jgi:hypothetical protein
VSTLREVEAEVAAVLNRDDLAVEVSRWVARAHLAIQLRHTWRCTESTFVASPLVAGSWTVPAPPDIHLPLQIAFYTSSTGAVGREIHLTSFETVRYLRKDNFRRALLGAFWSGLLELSEPVDSGIVSPDAGIRYDYHRFVPPPALPDDRDWFTLYAAPVLVYRALEESAPFLGDDPRLSTWRERSADLFKELLGAETHAGIAGELIMRG